MYDSKDIKAIEGDDGGNNIYYEVGATYKPEVLIIGIHGRKSIIQDMYWYDIFTQKKGEDDPRKHELVASVNARAVARIYWVTTE